MDTVLLAINGTLMGGLELNPNLLVVGATFVRETTTEAAYRLWSIHDRHPAMVRVKNGGVWRLRSGRCRRPGWWPFSSRNRPD